MKDAVSLEQTMTVQMACSILPTGSLSPYAVTSVAQVDRRHRILHVKCQRINDFNDCVTLIVDGCLTSEAS